MNEFELTESVGRKKAKRLFNKYELVESDNIFSCWDFSGRTQSIADEAVNYFIEVKNRDLKSTTYDTTFLEVEKLNALKAVADANEKAAIFYLCFFNDDIAYMFNLRKIDITNVSIFQMNLRHKTAIDVGIKQKLLIEIPLELGKRYKVN
ncbi:hypothetical protein [Mucilaginibacter defluvii]|uniref:Uncharacterized protein n=1 Tax=Mucilaginibacter defluvii TaxID=1196019 RepID=A0ABP9FMA5_9SPHI